MLPSLEDHHGEHEPTSLRRLVGRKQPQPSSATARLLDAWHIELMTPRTIMESYKVLRTGATEDRSIEMACVPIEPPGDELRWACSTAAGRRGPMTRRPRDRSRTSKPGRVDAGFLGW